jgi:hypothetical protein
MEGAIAEFGSVVAMECTGGCHCGNLQVKLRLSKEPEQMAIRTCTCSFCRAHAPRMMSDTKGSFEISAADWTTVRYYRFGTRTCDFLLCGRCGVFIAAVTEAPSPRAVVNVNCLEERARFSGVPALHNFDGETAEARQARHNANWMPASLRRETILPLGEGYRI